MLKFGRNFEFKNHRLSWLTWKIVVIGTSRAFPEKVSLHQNSYKAFDFEIHLYNAVDLVLGLLKRVSFWRDKITVDGVLKTHFLKPVGFWKVCTQKQTRFKTINLLRKKDLFCIFSGCLKSMIWIQFLSGRFTGKNFTKFQYFFLSFYNASEFEVATLQLVIFWFNFFSTKSQVLI